MVTYLIKSGLCLALLLAFYHLVLEREKMHQFNRFYLLGSLLFSFIAPFYKIYIETIPNTLKVTPSLITDSTMNVNTIEEVNYTQYLFIVYTIVAIILLTRFTKNLFDIFLKIKQHQKIKKGKATLVLVDDLISPHTFWNYIFINKKEYNTNKIETELYTHELTHALQKHTFDVLLIEFLQIIFWINPTFIFLKKAVKLNHEFLADNKVVTTHKNTIEYQYLLLNRATWSNKYYLASNLNYLLTKKRLLMMTKQSSRTKILLKKLAVIPVLAGFTFLFAEKVEAEITKKHEYEEKTHVLSTETSKDSIPSSVTVYRKRVNHEDAEITYHDEKGNKITKKFSELTEKEKEQLPPPPPIRRVSKRTPPPNSNTRVVREKISSIPPPPIDAIEYIYQNKNADFYFDDKKVGYNEVIKLTKNKKGLRTISHAKNNKKIIKFYSKRVNKNTNNINFSDVKYYLDGKLISKEKLDKIAPKDIKKVDVKKNKDGTGSVYVTSNK
ncbi:M56 family metallopeptidase [Tenacibaculum caenipelagi]|uniref:Beta-lactamase regulating signal transducer with metallopeptidase domain n=1 Tax=Tenacibaculum caenipelagi TaxID=1325435 RepID=A0A4R6TCS4_9FLAO|nr:M56 family metallopeptidase [Tenacibaculum caenipelagi]TDQ22737.1 beta-lactamase regulating signal transducer with metallopeptidase domain [Tenacibaculum caenipelagi]